MGDDPIDGPVDKYDGGNDERGCSSFDDIRSHGLGVTTTNVATMIIGKNETFLGFVANDDSAM